MSQTCVSRRMQQAGTRELQLRLEPNAGLGVDHDVGDRQGKALACPGHDVALEPVRAPFGGGGDDDLVCTECAQDVLDRAQGILVSDLTLGLDADRVELAEGLVEPLLSLCPRAVQIGYPVTNG